MWTVFMLAAVMVGESSSLPPGVPPLHSIMTDEEFKYYFGDKTEAEIEKSYDLGMIRKVEDSAVEEARFRRLGYQKLGQDDNEGEEWWFEAFGQKKQLNLKKNRILVSERANIVWLGEDGEELERKNIKVEKLDCHKIHKSVDMVAAVSNCMGGDQLTGFVSTLEDTYSLDPLTERLKNKVEVKLVNYFRNNPGNQEMTTKGLYIFQKVTFPNFTTEFEDNKEQQWDNTAKSEDDDDDSEFPIEDDEEDDYPVEELEVDGAGQNNKVIEAGIFFDHLAYNRFAAIYNDSMIENMLWAYINQVAAIYRLPSLDQEIDIMVTQMQIQKGKMFDNMEGEREALLESFCVYSNSHNPPDDQANPRHYDVGILVSGLDIWKEKNGVIGTETLGLARTNGMCHSKYSCVVVEFGVRGALGNSYPTTGFSAAYTLAHELGHSLGMSHDTWADSNSFIMSASRSLSRGQMTWSKSSQESLKKNQKRLDCIVDRPQHPGLGDENDRSPVPGYFITPQEQCRIFFAGKKDVDVANDPDDDTFCKHLICSQGELKDGAGPPLEGTLCGGDGGNWCREGACVPIQPFRWSHWRSGPCTSACTVKGTGARDLVRHCERLPGYSIVEWRSNNEDACGEGAGHKVELCGDAMLCGARRGKRTRAQLANWMCEQEAPFHPALSRQEGGRSQGSYAPYSDTEPWKACLLYCKRADGDGWVNPRNKNFPDGTWCHTGDSGDYYCQAGQCLPPSVGEDVMAVP